nr:unnamed protein product [Digitaria exilis]
MRCCAASGSHARLCNLPPAPEAELQRRQLLKIRLGVLCVRVGYLAPEFYSKEITLKLDIYSLGVVIMEILTGEKGFSSAEKVRAIFMSGFKIN